MSLRRRHLSPLTQFLTIAILALFVGVAILAWPVIGKNVADPAGRPQPAPSEEARGTFRPTKEQWAGFKIEPVGLVSFRPEQVTEGSIAIDDDLTTPVFSQHSGRVIKLIAKLGDRVEAGAPLFEIQATEFVQAQNDLITALANLQTARSQLAQAQTNERRAHDLYLAQGGALKDWQQAQTDLITSQNTVRADEIALAKLEMVGLDPAVAEKFPAELSGGMIKRVALARALALDPELVFLDEPTSGLDPIGAGDFDELVRTLQRTLGLTVFMVTHDLDSLYTACDRIAVLGNGKIIAAGSMADMQASQHPWLRQYFHGKRARAVMG